jgi:uncharacterized repeat protein (TIGR01451 family)
MYATDLAVMPGSPSTVAVSAGPLAIYDNQTARADPSNSGPYYLAFGANASTLYGYASNNLAIIPVDSSGIGTITNPSNSGTFSTDLRYDSGRLYLTSGGVLDATSGNLLGTFAAVGSVAPDSTLGRAFVLNSSTQFDILDQITAFDVNTFLPLGSIPLGGLQTGVEDATALVRWGQNGLAFRTQTQVFVLQSPVVRDLSASPADVAISVSAPATSSTGTNTTATLTVKNNGPNAASGVTLTDAIPGNAILQSATPSQGTCSGGAFAICDLGNLSDGATVTVAVVLIPTSAGTLSNAATVTATSSDPNQSNNTAGSATAVTGSGYSPAPSVATVTPQSAPAGSAALTITIQGANFVSTSLVNWNGSSLPTTYVSDSQLTATISASLLAAAGSADISVASIAPGGGVSGLLPFSIFQSVALDTNDIVFDPFTRKIYASVPSTATQVAGNSIVSIDPLTGTLGTPVPLGSEPTRLALSDDGKYLYATLAGNNSVRRLDLTTLTAGTQFQTTSPLFGPYVASDLAVMPGNHDILASVGYSDGIQIWDVGTAGVTSFSLTSSLVNDVYEGSVLAWGDSTHLYSNDEGLSPSSLHRFTVGTSSFSEVDSTYLDAVDNKITYAGGLIYADGGGVVDPSPLAPQGPRLVGRFPTGGPSAADPTVGRVFFLDQNNYGATAHVISAFDSLHFTSIGTTELDDMAGDVFDLIRWGTDGLAFRTEVDFWGAGSQRVVLLHGPFVVPHSAVPNLIPSITTLIPNTASVGTGNTWLSVTGAQFIPGSVVTWNGVARTTVFVSSGQLRAAIPFGDMATAQTATVKVVNPAPGGGPSGAAAFVVH